MMIYVLGLGNVLMGDDGFGPAAIRAFDTEYATGADVEVVDLGTPGLDLSPWFFGAERVILVDTIRSDAAPGTVRLYGKADILRHAPGPRTGPHDPGVKEALLTADLAQHGPEEVLLIGAVAERVAMDLDLTPALDSAIPVAVNAIVTTLRRWGATVRKRSAPLPAAAWWQ